MLCVNVLVICNVIREHRLFQIQIFLWFISQKLALALVIDVIILGFWDWNLVLVTAFYSSQSSLISGQVFTVWTIYAMNSDFRILISGSEVSNLISSRSWKFLKNVVGDLCSIDGSDKGGSDWALARFVCRGSELSAPTPAERNESRDNAEPPMEAQSSPSHILLTIMWQFVL